MASGYEEEGKGRERGTQERNGGAQRGKGKRVKKNGKGGAGGRIGKQRKR